MTAIDQLVAALRALSGDRDRGATAVEYGLIASLIAAVIAAVVGTLGLDVVALYTTVIDAF
ncbi:Flp family type IVb pilin [Ornithinimicrobium sediminis]|uniref:Flp family type IVb pilin n=1 Tax=Ornithinimicrobium sediminis TaxID=2904603 RepID=UPI001E4E72EA|nr:Flp family type IVb pilin [Ornithinimicrobium sediminis]MCE0488171.1 Flp family type IVb pilin [Ornithinimicrobium sediminis]